MKRARLVLLDTHAILHRAYHALPDLSSSKGEPTGALYGLMTMLLKSIADLKPEYVVAALDRAEKTHRHELFEEYKGTRAKTEDTLVAQIKRTGEVFQAFGIPTLDAPGFEADDVIGSVVKQVAKRNDMETVILTGDMDMLQLVDDGRVSVYRLLTGISNMKFYDEDAVKERYGFGPEYVPDFKGIAGDQSDNIKGVPGVGEGGASKLVQTFGSLEQIYKAIQKDGVESVAKKAGVQKRYVQLVADNKDSAEFSKQLATIRRDAPITFEQPDHPWRLRDHANTIAQLCDEFEFKSLKARVLHTDEEVQQTDDNIEAVVEAPATREFREASVALWLIHSDTSNPTLEDIFDHTKVNDLTKAREKLFAELKETGRLKVVFETIERPLIPVVEKMNATGILVDVAHMQELEREYAKELGKIAGRIFKHAGHEFNINSPRQLANVLYEELKISPTKQKKTPTGAKTTREEELVKMASLHPIIGDILSYRELQKLLSTYIQKIPGLVGEDGRLHTEFVQAGTTTGRMASQNPNLQNIPIKSEYGRRIREAFVAPKEGMLAAIDYSQIELRLAAGLSGDEKLVRVFKEGGDIHTAVAADVFAVTPDKVDYEMRRRAKVINFGILYGMGVNALRATLGESVTRDEAASYLDAYFKKYDGLAQWIEKTKKIAAKQGFTETLFGRRRYFPGLSSPLPNIRAQAERMAVNAPLQGTQSDIIKLAMVEADTRIEKEGWGNKAKLILQVHDELVYEVDSKEAETIAKTLRDVMESVAPTKELHDVPIVANVKLGRNWGNLEEVTR